MKQFKPNNDHANSKNRLAEIIEISTKKIITFFFLEREFQPMASALDDSSLSSDQDTNQFLVQAGIEPQISYTVEMA